MLFTEEDLGHVSSKLHLNIWLIFGEKICYNSGDIELFLADCFLLAHPVHMQYAQVNDSCNGQH